MSSAFSSSLNFSHELNHDSHIHSELQRTSYQTSNIVRRIGSMELFLSENNSCMLKITSEGIHGWGECVLGENSQSIDLVSWGGVFADLKGLSMPECLLLIKSQETSWGLQRCTLAQSALFHLAWQIQYQNNQTNEAADRSLLSRSYLIQHSQSYYLL